MSLKQQQWTESTKARPQKSLNEKQHECQDILIRCIADSLGFSKGQPVAACIIYKCLKQWKSFEVKETNIFDRIIQTIGQKVEVYTNSMDLYSRIYS